MVLCEAQRLLSLSEAGALLHSLGRTVVRVVRCCDDDAILFLGAFGRPWTAWVTRADDGVAVRYEEGWSAWLGSCSRVSAPHAPPATRRAAFTAAEALDALGDDEPPEYAGPFAD